ncbi:MAG: TetR/AcrR family transcriptional regulator [Mariprofundus sp.]
MQEDRIRHQILEAAARRFADYGYGKTTIAEIAGDCAMSSGNIYRYFDNKEAIAMAGVAEKLEEKAATCEQAVDAESTAIEQLEQYMLARLRFTHELSCGGCHLHELVQLITERHHSLIEQYDERVVGRLAIIIEQGIARGEFRPQDARQSATAISVATVMFCIPTFMQEPLESMEAKLDCLFGLLHQGLKV